MFYVFAGILMSINLIYFADIWCIDKKDHGFWNNLFNIALKVLLLLNVVFADYLLI
jgi:hypothetical protein